MTTLLEAAKAEIKPCPCGKTPTSIAAHAEHDRPKWAYAIPDCCGEWEIEYRNQYVEIDSDEGRKNALDAWNEAPRQAVQEAQDAEVYTPMTDDEWFCFLEVEPDNDSKHHFLKEVERAVIERLGMRWPE